MLQLLQLLARRGAAPPLLEKAVLHIEPPAVQRLGAAEALDLHDRVGPIDEQLIAVAGRPYFAANDAAPAAEKADHVCTIGTPCRLNREWYYPKPLRLSRFKR